MNYRQQLAILGTGTNDDAVAGYAGETITGARLAASALALTTAVAASLTSIVLTPGDWDVDGIVAFIPAATTSITRVSGCSSLVDNTVAGVDEGSLFQWASAANVAVQVEGYGLPTRRVKVPAAGTTTVYLVALATFTVSTMTAFGSIRARRMR